MVGLILPRAPNITKGGWGVTFQNVPHCLLFSSNGTGHRHGRSCDPDLGPCTDLEGNFGEPSLSP